MITELYKNFIYLLITLAAFSGKRTVTVWGLSVRLSVCPSRLFLTLTERAAHTQSESPGGSMRRGQRAFRRGSKEDRHTCLRQVWRRSGWTSEETWRSGHSEGDRQAEGMRDRRAELVHGMSQGRVRPAQTASRQIRTRLRELPATVCVPCRCAFALTLQNRQFIILLLRAHKLSSETGSGQVFKPNTADWWLVCATSGKMKIRRWSTLSLCNNYLSLSYLFNYLSLKYK